MFHDDGSEAHYVMPPKTQRKPFWLATQFYPGHDDWAEPSWQFRLRNYDVFAQDPLVKR